MLLLQLKFSVHLSHVMEESAFSSSPSYCLICITNWLNLSNILAVLQELVWESVAIMNRQMYTEIPVVFEDVRFHRATNIPKEGKYCGALGWSFMIVVLHMIYMICVSC